GVRTLVSVDVRRVLGVDGEDAESLVVDVVDPREPAVLHGRGDTRVPAGEHEDAPGLGTADFGTARGRPSRDGTFLVEGNERRHRGGTHGGAAGEKTGADYLERESTGAL